MRELSLPVFFVILVFIIFSCSGPGGEPPVNLSAPEGVSAYLAGGSVFVSWQAVPGADSYRVLRKAGEGVFEIITSSPVSGTSILDTSFPVEKPLHYAVQSGVRGFFSSISTTSNSVTPNVQNVEATVLRSSGIKVMWSHISDINFGQYEIRRFTSRGDTNFIILGQSTLNEFNDATASSEVAYFYQVVWKTSDGSTTNGENGPLVFGLRSMESDTFEKNDSIADLKDSGSSVFQDWGNSDWSKAPQVYSYPDGAGGVEADRDWYKYEGPATTIFVDIELPSVSAFDEPDCRLFFRFYYDGAYQGTAKEVTPGGFFDSFGDFGSSPPGEVDLYFEVFPVTSTEREAIGKYKIRWSDSF